MSSVTIADTCYLLGGRDAYNDDVATVLCASVTSLIQKATSPTHQSARHTSVWKTLPDTPMLCSAAVSLSGHLLTVGGNGKVLFVNRASPAVHIFLQSPFANSWVRVTHGDLPQPRYSCAAVQLSSNTMIVIGGRDDSLFNIHMDKAVFMGTITV